MPTPPKETVYEVNHACFCCEGKKEAIQIANKVASEMKKLSCDGLCMIVLSNINPRKVKLTVNSQGHKVLTPAYPKVPWHFHILLLSKPGKTIADDIHSYLRTTYPCRGTLFYPKMCTGERIPDRINYFLEQSVIIRTVAMGDPYRLAHREEFLRMIDQKAKEIGYQWLAITRDYL